MSDVPQFTKWEALGLLPGAPEAVRVMADYPWEQAFRQAADYADGFMASDLGHQAVAESWGCRLRSYVQIAAWRQLCSGARAASVVVPQRCIDHWRVGWVNGIRAAEEEALCDASDAGADVKGHCR